MLLVVRVSSLFIHVQRPQVQGSLRATGNGKLRQEAVRRITTGAGEWSRWLIASTLNTTLLRNHMFGLLSIMYMVMCAHTHMILAYIQHMYYLFTDSKI